MVMHIAYIARAAKANSPKASLRLVIQFIFIVLSLISLWNIFVFRLDTGSQTTCHNDPGNLY